MSIIMYKKGDTHNVRGIPCTAEVMKGTHFNFKAMEKQGWYLDPKNIPIEEPKSDEEIIDLEAESLDEDSEEDEIRQRAKAAGIKSWHIKGIDRLQEELKDAEQPEIGPD